MILKTITRTRTLKGGGFGLNQVKKKHMISKHQVEKDLGHRIGHVTTHIHFGRGRGHYGWKMVFISY